MPRKEINYTNTVIYKIVCNDLTVTDLYVGHTTDFTKRKNAHKTDCNNVNGKHYNLKVYKMIRDNGGWTNWTMVEIEKYECNDSNEAKARERYYLELLNAQLNSSVPGRSRKQYKEANKKAITLYQKQYNEANKDAKLLYHKQYYEQNKEAISLKKKQYKEANKEAITLKKKQHYEQNKEAILLKQKQYHEQNKEARLLYQKQYNEANKEARKQYLEANKEAILLKQKQKYIKKKSENVI
jgi:hypothetical protein